MAKNSPSSASTVRVTQAFDDLWSCHQLSTDIPSNPKERIELITHILKDWQRKRILEIGSGSGQLSFELASRGAEVTLLDTSLNALRLSQKVFNQRPANYLKADMFFLPFPDKTFDFVFSAGVVEHYPPEETEQAICEHARVTKNSGHVLILTPSSRGLIYRFAKILLEWTGRWQVGYERPIRSLKGSAPDRLSLVFESQTEIYAQIEMLPRILRRRLLPLAKRLTQGDTNHPLAIKLLGGRVLNTLFKRI